MAPYRLCADPNGALARGLNFKVCLGNVLTPGSGPIAFQGPDVFITPSGRWRMLFGESSRGNNKMRIADGQ